MCRYIFYGFAEKQGRHATAVNGTFASCLYFNPTFTVTMMTLSYVSYLISCFLRNMTTSGNGYGELWSGENVGIVIVGFTVEFIISALFFYALTMLSRDLFVKQQITMAELEIKNEKLRMAMGAATDVLFDYDVEKDIYKGNRTIRGWTEKDITIEHFTEYIKTMNWETSAFIDLFHEVIHIPEEKGNQIPILALSANAFQEDVKMSMMAGMNAHLTKPVRMEKIMEELGKVQNEDID